MATVKVNGFQGIYSRIESSGCHGLLPLKKKRKKKEKTAID